jgi:hypothetical protein
MVFALSRTPIKMDLACCMLVWKSSYCNTRSVFEIDTRFCEATFNYLENYETLKNVLNIKCVLFFCTMFFEAYFSLMNIWRLLVEPSINMSDILYISFF